MTAAIPLHLPRDSRTLSDRIREETAALHRQLEDELDLMSPSLTLDRYGRVVAAFESFLAPWETARDEAMRDAAGAVPSPTASLFAERRHARRARQDREALELPGTAPCERLPLLGDAPSAWGSSYVIEGSTLGGKFITAAVGDRLGFTPERGCSYFAGYGAANGAMWVAFRSAMAASIGPEEESRAIEGAIETYRALRRWLTECGAMA